jgi:hypothetical protein
LVPAAVIRPAIADLIRAHRLHWSGDGFLCHLDLIRYREQYVENLLLVEKGELTDLERDVVAAMARHETVAQHVDSDYDQNLTVGERLSDKIAIFGGSWKFFITFFLILAAWIAINSVLNSRAPVRPVSVHPPEPDPVVLRSDPSTDDHDEPEPPGVEGPSAIRTRLTREPEGGIGNPPPARKDGPPAEPPMGTAG